MSDFDLADPEAWPSGSSPARVQQTWAGRFRDAPADHLEQCTAARQSLTTTKKFYVRST